MSYRSCNLHNSYKLYDSYELYITHMSYIIYMSYVFGYFTNCLKFFKVARFTIKKIF